VIGRNVSILMPEPDRSSHDGYLRKYHQTGKAGIIGIGRQVMGQKRDGTLLPIDLAVSEVRIGDRVLFTGIMRDMTERHETESELRVAQQRLIQSERLAAIGQMMTGLAHESRNALQRSRACLDMLDLDLQSEPEQQDLVKRTRAALVELQVLYEEVRSYAAPIHLEKTLEDVAALCKESWQNLEEVWRGREIQLCLDCVGCTNVPCDRHRIGQVLRNIFENSLAVIPDRSTIYVHCQTLNRERDAVVRVSITDEGPGLNAEQKERIFEPFFTTKTKGTGLGMAICNRILEAHGGRIYVGNDSSNAPSSNSTPGATIVVELSKAS
jgi:two-component system, LuxR family, sensor kinase FixL